MNRDLTRLNRRLDAALTQFGVTEFAKMSKDTFKAVWRHHYKLAKKAKGDLQRIGGGDVELPDGNKYLRNKSGLLWRGTHKGEVEQIAKGRFKSAWTTPYHPGKKRTYVAGNPQMTEHYAGTAAVHANDRGALQSSRGMFPANDTREKVIEHLPKARIIGVSGQALKRSDNQVRGAVGDFARTAPLRGGIAAREVRTILRPRAVKPGARKIYWEPVPLGDVMKKSF
jgi:hypothetical protein